MDDEIQVPEYFLCPISLQIMKDPVTTVTGITYDRDSIEQWLAKPATADDAAITCPVTKQPLSRGSELIPNHMLRRLIQAWCIAGGIDPIPTPKSPLRRSEVLKLIRDVNNCSDSLRNLRALKKMDELAKESEKNQKCMAEAGVVKAMVSVVSRCFKEAKTLGLDRALRILQLTWIPNAENTRAVGENLDFVQSIMWVLKTDMEIQAKTQALIVLKNATEVASCSFLERLELNFFNEMVRLMRENITPQATRAVLQILIKLCVPSSGRNKPKIIEARAVFELIEMEVGNPEKKTTELIFCLLATLCSCADGRQQLLQHAGGIAVVAKRLLRVSPSTDDRALCIFEAIARSSATREVVSEMLRVGGVSKLCMVLQADCGGYLKTKAREILRLHSSIWSNSPCIQVYLLTRDPR